MYYTAVDTAAGALLLTGDDQAITGIYWKTFKHAPLTRPDWIENKSIFKEAIGQLEEYFAGKRQSFNLAYTITGTPFQISVWKELNKLSYGKSSTYKDLATRAGYPNAARAVGTAVGNNPLSIVIPCHRVLGTGGKITGYAGGIGSKAILLALEGIAHTA